MLLGNGAANSAQSGSVSVNNLKLSVHLALILDGILDLRVCKNLIIQTRSIGVHLVQQYKHVRENIQLCPT